MTATAEYDDGSPTILLFGPHVGTFTKKSIGKLVRPLLHGAHREWFLDTIAGLSAHWDALTATMPSIAGAIPGRRQLADLQSWLGGDGLVSVAAEDDVDAILPSIMVGPLVVFIQLAQYWAYLERTKPEHLGDTADPHADLVARQKRPGAPRAETLGFCAGLLAAVAVASAGNRSEFYEYGAVAVRLAMLIGAVVDAQEVWDKGNGKGGSVSYAVAWRGQKQADEVAAIVERMYPDAYVAVLLDEARVTLTTSQRSAPLLLNQLRAAGVIVSEIGIKGYIHSPNADRKDDTDLLVDFCKSSPDLQYPDAASLALPTHNNSNHGERGVSLVRPDGGSLTDMVLRAILVQQCNWYGTFVAATKREKDPFIVTFGVERCVPSSLTRSLAGRQVHFEDLAGRVATPATTPGSSSSSGSEISMVLVDDTASPQTQPQPQPQSVSSSTDSRLGLDSGMEEAIAVIGMSVKTAGADDLDEFAEMLKTGQSQHELITRDRLMHDMLFREAPDSDPNRKFYGCFFRDADAFDHKFFKRSPREAKAMEPQGRLVLQAAYQAVEQSGYFNEPTFAPAEQEGRDKRHVGVYLGSCGIDYEHNLTCHEPNAFTATGALKSFITGRVSHYFGWTGPCMTFDTACSSSLVAIHTACRNLLAGECTAALAGGSNTITNLLWFQNLSAGSFVSPTGQCKPFDDAADGYCRAEGLAFVFLKRLSDAVRDGNPVLATIPATAVHQNQNCTPLFVPNSPSLTVLFKEVLRRTGTAARDVSLVEAHGTGTPVGDPAEYESIRAALAGPGASRTKPLPIGSVKGHIGHTEGASGVIALVKLLVMMRGGFIPPQASFTRLSRNIDARPDDMMEVVTQLRPWEEQTKIALLNNYGACGSNASLVVVHRPEQQLVPPHRTTAGTSHSSRYPFWITGFDARAIAAYAAKLHTFLLTSRSTNTLADISFNMNRQSNRTLPQALIFTCASPAELHTKLSQAAATPPQAVPTPTRPPSVILCFGGQVSRSIGLDRDLFRRAAVLRAHLDACDAVLLAQGLESVYAGPDDIFSRAPVADTVKLQTMLFALHFGEIAALCVAGVLGLGDAVKLVAARARLVRDLWGVDKGAMVLVEGEQAVVRELLEETNRGLGGIGGASIACYNQPRCFTLAGSTAAIDAVQARIAASADGRFGTLKGKRLDVTNAFHSALVHDDLVEALGQIGKELTFLPPSIPVERATEAPSSDTGDLDWTFVPRHMRQPVFFSHAVQRLAKQHPQAVFLEAGSGSGITVMAARALAQSPAPPPSDAYHFQPVSITTADRGFDGLTDATVALWQQGVRVCFWPHHALQTREYATILLPPYQFDKSASSRHWLPMKSPREAIEKAAEALLAARQLDQPQASRMEDPATQALWEFVGYQDSKQGEARFRINTGSAAYKSLVLGHVIAQTAPICPGTLECDIVIEALFSLHPGAREAGVLPDVRDLVNHAPICVDPGKRVYLDLSKVDENGKKTRKNKKKKKQEMEGEWVMRIFSVPVVDGVEKPAGETTHAEARVHLRSPADAAYIQEFSRFERLVRHDRCLEMLSLGLDAEGVEVLQGRHVYQAFAPVVDYGEVYRGVRYLVSSGDECAGLVRLDRCHRRTETWLDVPLSDSFSQVGGLWANVMMPDLPPGDMYIATGCERSMRSPRALPPRAETDVFHVYARHERQGDMGSVADLFVFDAATGVLVEVMLGVQYGRVSKASMGRMLARLTTDKSVVRSTSQGVPGPPQGQLAPTHSSTPTLVTTAHRSADTPQGKKTRVGVEKKKKDKMKKGKTSQGSDRRDITDEVRNLVANVSGIDASELADLDLEMADFGIDSLMGMELGREVELAFKCKLDQNEQMEATTLRKFVACVSNALFGKDGVVSGKERGGDNDHEDETSEDETESEDEGDKDTDQDDSSGGESWSVPSLTDTGKDSPSSSGTPASYVHLHAPNATSSPSSSKPLGATLPPPSLSTLALPSSDVLQSFAAIKLGTDDLMRQYKIDKTERNHLAGSNRLCAALVVEAFDELGSPLRTAAPGQILDRVPFLPQHARLMQCVYQFLERDARLIDVDPATGQLTRTRIAAPRKDSRAVLDELLACQPEFAVPNRLTYYAGRQLAGVLSGKTDGIRVLFGSAEGRELTAAMYCEHMFNRMNYEQMRGVVEGLVERMVRRGGDKVEGTFKVLEMGAGTGGTTLVMAPFLASLAAKGVLNVEYTFTDLSPSMVANARRRFGKLYTFMRFAVHDIEKPPGDDLRGQYHLVLASNAIHATHSLAVSLANARQALRPDGFMMLLEMTEVVPFIDLVFGLLEGWWLFDDGRHHAVVPAEHWERELHAAGFGHVDWTDGHLPENTFQKVIFAMASGAQGPRLPVSTPIPTVEVAKGDVEARTTEAERLVAKYSAGWDTPELQALHDRLTKTKTMPRATSTATDRGGAVVLVTGATGSLGSHIVQKLAEHHGVAHVVCLNRRRSNSSLSPAERQQEAFRSRGIVLSPPEAHSKLRVLESDTSQRQLGLLPDEYAWLVEHGTHIVHNAWPMSGTRPISAFEPQLQTMRNLLDLARDMAINDLHPPRRITFHFISSIGVVGHAGTPRALEQRYPLAAVLPSGYGEAKWVCERLLDATLHRYGGATGAALFRAAVVRPGQIAGSSISGAWNPVEHLAFLVRSAQALRTWPDLGGVLQWIPVDRCAGVVVDLLRLDVRAKKQDEGGEVHDDGGGGGGGDGEYPVYHVDNPVGQPWKDMSPVLAAALDIPVQNIVPFKKWIRMVRRSPLLAETENPAARLVDFLDDHFERMSCGGLILDTSRAQEHSETMARELPVSPDLARRYVAEWKRIGFLDP